MPVEAFETSESGRWLRPSSNVLEALMRGRQEHAARSPSVRYPTGQSSQIRDINRQIHQVARHDSTVLILGESGTGKEVAARAIHDASPRASRPFVPVNCGAIPAELLESELFGHEKGAFTGAISTRKGRFEIAEGGTLFLDEIGDMSPTMQVKLLRVLQERIFERVGGGSPQRCDVRIIAATHRNLEESIQKGAFREDLFYRLNVFPLEMPSLRDRTEDIGLLIADITGRLAAIDGVRVRLSTSAQAALQRHRWPGNVRELHNLLERLAIQCGDRLVQVSDLPSRYRPADWQPSAADLAADERELAIEMEAPAAVALSPESELGLLGAAETTQGIAEADVHFDAAVLPAAGLDLRAHLDAIERKLIEQALRRSDGIVAHAARLLGLRRTTLVEKLRKFALVAVDSNGATDS
jgi:Transcriptional regulator containing PAS, AAA-type ATPase, and DNA-binding domains